MYDWIYSLVASSVAGVKKLADAAIERIAWLYTIVVTIGLNVRSGWNSLRGIYRLFADKIGSVTLNIYLTFYWLIWIRLPQVVTSAEARIFEWSSDLISTSINGVVALINAVVNWARNEILDVIKTAREFRDWITGIASDLWLQLAEVRATVFDLLTSPERLAKWAIGAILRELLTFIDEHADQIGEIIRRRSLYYAGRVAVRIEDVISRLI